MHVSLTTDTDKLYVIRNQIGGASQVMAYAARLVTLEDDGSIMVCSGSAKWMLNDEMTATPLTVGEKFDHWLHGPIEVTKVNRVTVKAISDGGDTITLVV